MQRVFPCSASWERAQLSMRGWLRRQRHSSAWSVASPAGCSEICCSMKCPQFCAPASTPCRAYSEHPWSRSHMPPDCTPNGGWPQGLSHTSPCGRSASDGTFPCHMSAFSVTQLLIGCMKVPGTSIRHTDVRCLLGPLGSGRWSMPGGHQASNGPARRAASRSPRRMCAGPSGERRPSWLRCPDERLDRSWAGSGADVSGLEALATH